jgi:hypothetical protein
MKKNPDTQFNFRSADLAEYYRENYGDSPSPISIRSLKAKSNLERYRLILEEALPQFTEEDAIAIFSALNGINTSHPEMLAILQQGIELDSPFREKVQSLSFVEWIAVVDACDRVGGGTYQIDDLASELRRVGILNFSAGSPAF